MFKLPSLSLYDKAIVIGVLLALVGLAVVSRPRSGHDSQPLIRVVPGSQGWLSGNEDVSVGEFIAAYASGVPHERQLAVAYLLGVLDSTEGTAWCGYKGVSLETIVHEIERDLQHLSRGDLGVRLSRALTDLLAARHPCLKT